MIEDHLGLALVLAGRASAELDQVLGIKPGIGVALEAARGPRQIDEEPAQDLACVGAGRAHRPGCTPEVVQSRPQLVVEIEVLIRPISREEARDVTDPGALDHRTANQRSNFSAGPRNGQLFGASAVVGGELIAALFATADRASPAVGDELCEAPL